MSLWSRLKSMTSHPAIDHGKVAYLWFEGQALRLNYPEGDTTAIDQYLEKRWTELPPKYKEQIVPELLNVLEVYKQANDAQTAADTTKCMTPDAWQQATEEQIELYADSFALGDERLLSLQKLLEVRKQCKAALSKLVGVRNGKDALTLFSREDAGMVTKILNEADGQVAGVEQEIRELEEALPILRQREDWYRNGRRDSGLPVGPGWLGNWYLGGGSYGKAYLWVRQDSQGRIVDRVVLKDARIGQTMAEEDEAWVLHEGVYVPAEIRVPQMLGGKPGSETILRVRGWREFPGEDFYRILLDFCPHGDLFDLRFTEYKQEDDDDPYHPKIPEPFLWYVFECLATAGVLMLRTAALQGWEQIYHSDIKLGNIMLGPPNPNKYCNYPSPVLADFGFAQFCPIGEGRVGRGGTPGSESPENTGFCYDKAGNFIDPAVLNSRSDVWSVANVIYGLMSINEGHPDMNFRHDIRPREAPIEELGYDYEGTLLDLVIQCMAYHPEDRPDFASLLGTIRKFTDPPQGARKDLARGLRHAAANDIDWQHPRHRLRTPADRFALYSKLMRVPDHKATVAHPPHRTRRLSAEKEFKGPASADSRSLRRAGSKRRHAAAHTKQSHDRWWYRRRKMAHMKRMQGGYHVPDSDDDAAADDEEDGEGGEDGGRDENVPRSQGAGASRVANSVAGVAEPAAMADITQHVAEEMDVWNLPAQQHAPSLNRKSRSAKAGAVLDQQEQQPQEPRHVVPHRRSASPGPVGQRPSPRARRSPPAVRDAVQKPQPPTKAPFRPAGPNNTRKISSGTTARFKVFLARQKAERAAEKAAAQKKTDDLLRRRGGT